jgi:hypothetical protein
MAAAILDGMAADWTPERLQDLLAAEFGESRILDGFVARPGGRGRTRAVGARLALHVSSGSVPGVSVTSLVRSLLVKSPVLLKPGRGDVVLPVLYLQALADLDPEVAAAAAVVYWPGGERVAEERALEVADLVVAYGSDASIGALRARVPAHIPFVAYHHRVSVAVVGKDALAGPALGPTAADVATAVALFDQRGCVSPQVVWVEEGGEAPPRSFARALADALGDLEGTLPSGVLDDGEASDLQQRRGTAEMLAAAREDVEVWSGGLSSWTVVYEGSSELGGGPGRFVRVRPLSAVEALAGELAPSGPWLQTVAVAGLGDRLGSLAEALARIGVTRITPLSRAPWPPPWWHHDGMGALEALVRRVDLEE